MNNFSIDIIIPAFRLNEKQLLGIIHLRRPEHFSISFFIVADNPSAKIPRSLAELDQNGSITILKHNINLGPSAARNTGIRAGNSKWILLLDDDIMPKEDLLFCYAEAIQNNGSSIGFAGITIFPEPVNESTKALITGGWISHFSAAVSHPFLRWSPTANIMLNREKVDETLFDESLTKSGEDIDFLVRNSLLFSELYVGLPNAVVFHPWWNDGTVQTKRMLRYGEGVSEIARKNPVKNYTFPDFTNLPETLLILLLLIPVSIFFGFFKMVWVSISVFVLAEFLTCWLKASLIGKTSSPVVAFYIMWTKNCYETAFLIRCLRDGYLKGFARRVDMGFSKQHPGPFRTNRWKITKMILIAILFLIAFISL